MKLKIAVVLTAFLVGAPDTSAQQQPDLLTAQDLADWQQPRADARLDYGDDPLQFGDLYVPEGPGPHPVAIYIHGGCWLAQYDIAHSSRAAAALAEAGIAAWSLEYRRVGDAGGGWPGTFRDIARGADYLRAIADDHDLDLERVISMGHSAGGHLALWLATRGRLRGGDLFTSETPLIPRGVLALTPAPDLAVLHKQQVCGHVIDGLMGGSPEEFPDRYRLADATQFAPLRIPQVVVTGKYDSSWGPSGLRYARVAEAVGDDVRLLEAPLSGHFEVIDPASSTWPLVIGAAREMLGLQPDSLAMSEADRSAVSAGSPADTGAARSTRDAVLLLYARAGVSKTDCPQPLRALAGSSDWVCGRTEDSSRQFRKAWEAAASESPSTVGVPVRALEQNWVRNGLAHRRTYGIGPANRLAVQYEDGLVATSYSRPETVARLTEILEANNGSESVTAPVAVHRPRPRYPAKSRESDKSVEVYVQFTVTEAGGVTDVRILDCTNPGHGFEEVTVAAVRSFKFEPATVDGRPVSVRWHDVIGFSAR